MPKILIFLVMLALVSCSSPTQEVSPATAAAQIIQPEATATTGLAPTLPTDLPTLVPTSARVIPLPPNDNDLFYKIQRGDSLESVAAKFGMTPDELAAINDPEMVRRFRPDTQLALFDRESILGRIYSEPGKKVIVVIGEQLAYAVDGSQLVHEPFVISTGIAAHPSPVGKFAVITKLKSMEMRGQSDTKGKMYDIPHVPYDQNFYSVYYLHGAYWHNAFGKPHSGGCINFKVDDSKWLYDWTDPVPVGSITYANQSNPGTTVWVIP